MDASWSALAAPALVDWCEPNYAVSARVAEWWNTLSSLAMVVMGLVGAWRVRRDGARFVIGMLGLAAVGAGSAAFHGTLLRVAQAADELPMVWLGLACVWALADRARPAGAGRPLARTLAVFGVLFCVAYATVPWAFHLFLAVYGAMVAWVAVRTMQLSWFPRAARPIRRWAALTVAGYLGGFFLFWVPEHVLLACDAAPQAFHLHSWWHLGAGFGTYAWWTWALHDRRRALADGTAAAAA
ncbi:MAG: ceramidase domain-containing protein [Myxococcota bacterium]